MLAAVVTGAASGIGRAVACSLAEDGLPVWAADINGAELERLAAEGSAKGWALSRRTVDVSDPQAVAQVLAELDASGDHLGAFVHCAGITWRGSMLDMPLPDYERIVSTNLTGSFICLTAAARMMVRQGTGGSIVAITSVNVLRPLVGQAVYSSTKAALDVLVRTLAVEVGSAGVRGQRSCCGRRRHAHEPSRPGEMISLSGYPWAALVRLKTSPTQCGSWSARTRAT